MCQEVREGSSLHLAVALPNFQHQCTRRNVNPEPAGLWYEACRIRDLTMRGTLGSSDTYYTEALIGSNGTQIANGCADVSFMDPETPKYLKFLEKLDPKNWKDQDHYKLMGLSKLRWEATEEQIKAAYRFKVLNHHPDKRHHRGGVNPEEDYFSCIIRAYEVLSNPDKRRSYDSIDHKFLDSIPSATEVASPDDFYEVFGPAFHQNARWSRNQPVPSLGDATTCIERVDAFYSFWYDFSTWREFSYLDEEDKERGENREERRWIEKQNKVKREERRKNEIKRIRKLVDNAYSCDPRILKFKENQRLQKEAEKQARLDLQRQKKEEEEKIRVEAEEKAIREKQELEEEQKQKQKQQKKERDSKKKALQKERKLLQDISKEHNYFTEDASERVTFMADFDALFRYLPLEKLTSLRESLSSTNGIPRRDVVLQYVKEMNTELSAESDAQIAQSSRSGDAGGGPEDGGCRWNEKETQLLVKAMTLFPVGTKSRWEVIASFINEKLPPVNGKPPKTGKDVVYRVKERHNIDDSEKHALGEKLIGSKANAIVVTNEVSVRSDVVNGDGPQVNGEAGAQWTPSEQKLLEQALKTFQSNEKDRWDRIAECIPGKTKKDCVKRFKELAEIVRSKKAAQQRVAEMERNKVR